MRFGRWTSLALLTLGAIPWSLSMSVLGMWILFSDHPGTLLSDPRCSIPAGVCALAGGQGVFLMCFADRVFPKADALMTRTIEGGLGMCFFLGGCMAAICAVTLGV